MKYVDEYKNPDFAKSIAKRINELASKISGNFKIMEVCGSHTMAIARYAIRSFLPENISLISGPGCPVCVTDAGYIDTAIELAKQGVKVCSFGDMVNVPGSETTLAKCRAEGLDINICYSPLQALDFAKENPNHEVVFLAIGFETTTAPIMALIDSAIDEGLENISILTAFKLVPPALEALTSDPEIEVDAFLVPSHVSAMIGANAYIPFVEHYKMPCVIASFEPVDILYGIERILQQVVDGKAEVENTYERIVTAEGNEIAQELINKYLDVYTPAWRGIGEIPNSGLKLKKEYSKYDAQVKFGLTIKNGKHNPACKCGDILKGKLLPDKCPMFGKVCNPLNPIGPCMVSSEGSCAAYYKYLRK